MSQLPAGLPRKIWIYWHSGFDSAPLLVKLCVASWRTYNPDWQLILLDKNNIHQYIDISTYPTLPSNSIAYLTDFYRFDLLLQHGGVWADATTFCTKPLADWLNFPSADESFVFKSSKPDRVITNWFLVATTKSELLSLWREAVIQFWQDNHFRKENYWSRQLIRKLMSLRKRHIIGNDVWFSHWLLKKLKLYPYPINMYLFERALSYHPELRMVWDKYQLMDTEAEFLQNGLGMLARVAPESKLFIEENQAPLYKLNWRQSPDFIEPSSNLGLLLNYHNKRLAELGLPLIESEPKKL